MKMQTLSAAVAFSVGIRAPTLIPYGRVTFPSRGRGERGELEGPASPDPRSAWRSGLARPSPEGCELKFSLPARRHVYVGKPLSWQTGAVVAFLAGDKGGQLTWQVYCRFCMIL